MTLGPTGPTSDITFGVRGKPFYFQGPYDDPYAILRTLDRAVGRSGYDYVLVDAAGTFAPGIFGLDGR